MRSGPRRLKAIMRHVVIRIAHRVLAWRITYKMLLALVALVPTARVRDTQNLFLLLRLSQTAFALMRTSFNGKPVAERERLAVHYLIPATNRLFDKNHVNYAQALLLTLEEYFLSKKTEQEFEQVIALFAPHAIAAGERFRRAFPLPQHVSTGTQRVALVTHSVSVTGFEVIMALGPSMRRYQPRILSMRLFDERHAQTTESAMRAAGIELILTPKQRYDVFDLRRLVIAQQVDVAIWPLPPFHMFFFFAFGLAAKQVWFSQYLRPKLSFTGLDEVITTGGAGTRAHKTYNGQSWAVLPHVLQMEGLTQKKQTQYLFTPARLEKLKQSEFMESVAAILERSPHTHFKWTGYHYDHEFAQFFDKRGLVGRHSYIPWMNNSALRNEIAASDLILSCFPLSLGSVEIMAANFKIPVVALYDDECNLYWRDIYWEALHGNETLREICFDRDGRSKILIAKTPEAYAEAALKVLADPELAATYADVYYRSYNYAYLNNPNDIEAMFTNFIEGLYKEKHHAVD